MGFQRPSIRDAQHGMPLILLSVVDWGFVRAERYKLKGLVIAGLWLACLATLVGNWDFRIYPKLYAEKLEGRECLKSYIMRTVSKNQR